jgi:hypothetical protein
MPHGSREPLFLKASAGGTDGDMYDAGDGDDDVFPHFVVDVEHGRPPVRPLLCGPGLVCTGDVNPMPNTCVKIRPPNICYQVGAHGPKP